MGKKNILFSISFPALKNILMIMIGAFVLLTSAKSQSARRSEYVSENKYRLTPAKIDENALIMQPIDSVFIPFYNNFMEYECPRLRNYMDLPDYKNDYYLYMTVDKKGSSTSHFKVTCVWTTIEYAESKKYRYAFYGDYKGFKVFLFSEIPLEGVLPIQNEDISILFKENGGPSDPKIWSFEFIDGRWVNH